MLTTKGRYAVMALVDMANKSRFLPEQKAISLADIAKSQQITVAYLEQIFSKLKNSGLVKSVRGPGGGYILSKPSEDIKISEIINAVEEKIKMTRCGSIEKSACSGSKGKCTTHDLWEGLSETIENYFESLTIQDVTEGKIKKVIQNKNQDSVSYNLMIN